MARFLIGHVAFPTKAAATAEVRRILHDSPLDVTLEDRDGSLIAALFAMHPRRNGTPVGFHVGLNNYHGNKQRGFQAVFADGTRDSFSYIPCLSPQADQPNLIQAMRAAIMLSQRVKLREAYQGRALLRCAFGCGTMLELAQAQVHHKWPKFRDIADAFIGLVGAPIVVHQSGDFGDEFANLELKRRWIQFHDAIAQRVVVCARCNAEDERRVTFMKTPNS